MPFSPWLPVLAPPWFPPRSTFPLPNTPWGDFARKYLKNSKNSNGAAELKASKCSRNRKTLPRATNTDIE